MPSLRRFPLPLPFLILAMMSLATASWGGLARLGWQLPWAETSLPWLSFHGPLMVGSFLGTLIIVERVVALRQAWAWIAPLLSGASGVVIVAGVLGWPAPLLLTLGSVGLVAISIAIVLRQATSFTLALVLAAILWTVGNALWLGGREIPTAVPWWIGFIVLTIVAERVELTRFRRSTRWKTPLLWVTFGIHVAGLTAGSIDDGAIGVAGTRVVGGTLVALAAWLLRYDIAWANVREAGAKRFTAVCLLAGHAWLGVAGVAIAAYGPTTEGFSHDAVLHAVFLGFAFSMIFAHAPIVFPAILGLPVPYRWTFWIHAALLELSLVVRIGSDVVAWAPGREWLGIANVAAVALFVLNTAGSTALAAWQARRSRRPT